MYRETGYQMSLHGNVINQQKVGRVLQKEGDSIIIIVFIYCVLIVISRSRYPYIYLGLVHVPVIVVLVDSVLLRLDGVVVVPRHPRQPRPGRQILSSMELVSLLSKYPQQIADF